MKSISIILLCLLSMQALRADETDSVKKLRAQAASYLSAFNQADAKAVAAHWAPDAVYTNRATGEQVRGREAIEQAFADWFSQGETLKLAVEINSIRLVTSEVAVEEGTASIQVPSGPPARSNYIAIHVNRDGRWLIDSIRETMVPERRPEAGPLDQLAWMIGKWLDQDADSTIETNCQWTKNRKFITRSFKVAIRDQIELEGTQVIGWDPINQTIRSWMFDSDGAFGQGVWTRDGNTWKIETNQVLANGDQASAVNIMSVVDEDTITWESIGRKVNDEFLPNIDAVTVRRQ